ncbi:hypothetical protein RLEG3_14545 [Rhizobium leguminosarum bv. trifolii WSM1689]|nr:hypothetical protein RLEG3_14545 [Rhizobium leguminosarum bv. trifolii WSM1689]
MLAVDGGEFGDGHGKHLLLVILGLVPRICCASTVADARDKPEHDGEKFAGLVS